MLSFHRNALCRSLQPLLRQGLPVQVIGGGRSLNGGRCSRAVLVDENKPFCGVSSQIAATIQDKAFDDLDGPIVRIAGLDSAVPFSPPQEEHYLPKVSDVVREARRLKAY